MRSFAYAALASIFAVPAQAQQDPLAPLQNPGAVSQIEAPVLTAPAQAPPVQYSTQPAPLPTLIIPKDWHEVFDAIDRGNWAAAQAGIATLPRGPVTSVAKAALYTAKGSPVVSLEAVEALLAEAPELPQAEQLARLAIARGSLQAPAYYQRRRIVNLGTAPTRYRAKPVQGDPIADQLRLTLDLSVKANDAAGAEALLVQSGPYMTYEGRAEAGQRVAWVYYVVGDDVNAKRVADTWRPGATGEWVSQAAWISGLAAWRQNNCEGASLAFREAAGSAIQRELRAGALYWAARAEQSCRRPRSVAPLLKAAAQSSESFYGLLARETLGMSTRLAPVPDSALASADSLPNVQRAIELIRIGERQRADELIRHQAAIGDPRQHRGLIEITKRLELAGTQYWL
ncbi:MAG: lytic transglycosylase domain-containing protein, partial [Sphingomicrobium sp.]